MLYTSKCLNRLWSIIRQKKLSAIARSGDKKNSCKNYNFFPLN